MRDGLTIKGRWRIEKYASEADRRAGRLMAPPAEFDNLLTTVGLQALGRLLTAQGAVTAFSNANAHIGVGNSNTAAAVGQTDLQGASKFRQPMEATYPTDPTGGVWVFRSVFASGDANFAWEEFGTFNAGSSGIMLNRGVNAQGTKISGQVWTATVTITVT